MDIAKFFNKNQLHKIIKAFNKVTKANEYLAAPEHYAAIFKKIGLRPTDQDIDSMARSNSDQLVDQASFIVMVYYFLRGADSREELIRAFSVFDDDGDGKIPVETVHKILKGFVHPVGHQQIDAIVAKLSTPENPLIDYTEMAKLLAPK